MATTPENLTPEQGMPRWVAQRIIEVRSDRDHQAKVNRIRAAVDNGTFQGRVTTTADLDRLTDEIS